MLKGVRRACLIAFAFSAIFNVFLLSTPLYSLQIFGTVVPLGSIEAPIILSAMCATAIMALVVLEIARDFVVLLQTSVRLDHEPGRHILENGLKFGAGAEALSLTGQRPLLDQLVDPLMHNIHRAFHG